MNDNDPAARLPSQMIGKKRQRAAKLRDLYIRQAIDDDVSDELVKELASVCLEYWSLLREFRDEPAVDDDDFPDVKPIRSRLGEKTQVRAESKSRGHDYTYEKVPAVLELDPEYLFELTHALDDLSQQLGFGAAAAQEVDVFGVDTDATGGEP
jgi:hypothetical protein